MQCVTMATLSSANTKYTAEQLTKATGISAETLATWGLTEATDSLTMSQLTEMASSDAQAKTVLEKIVAQNAQAVANGEVTTSNVALATSETGATLATGSLTTAIKANIAAMWTWMTTTPLGRLTLLAAGIFATVKAYDALTVSVEEANEKIDESRSAYEETTSTIQSMNSELETTKQKIDELEAKGTLSFTDKEELENLKEQNDELERSIALQEKKRQNEAKQTVVDIKQNKDTLSDDFKKSIENLSEYKKEYEDTKQKGLKEISKGTVTLENYEITMTAMDKTMGQYENTVLDNIEKFEQYKEDIINKYGTDDISIFSQSDRSLYESIVNQLQSAYKEIYTDSEYNKFVIEPIFNEEKLKGLQDELLKYFISGGQTDLSSLEEKFGSDIITALRNACIRAGVDFDKMIGDIYNNSQSKLNKIAPIVENPNGSYDAKQNNVSKQIRDYIQNDLSEEDRTILLNAEIPDDVKFKTKKDVDDFVASLKTDTSNTTDILSFSDAWASLDNSTEETLKNTKSELTKLAEAGQLSAQSLKDVDGAEEYFKKIGLSAQEASNKINELVTSSNQLSSMRSGITSITGALETKMSDGVVSADKLGGFDVSLQGLETWQEFEEVMGNSQSSMAECQEVANKLATEYVNSANFLSHLTEENKDYYVSQLAEMGVTNALEVVNASLVNSENALAVAQSEVTKYCETSTEAKQKYANMDLSSAEADDIMALYNEANASGVATNGLRQLLAAKYNANNLSVATAADCSALANLYSYSITAKNALLALADAKRQAMSTTSTKSGALTAASERSKGTQKAAENAMKNANQTKVDVNVGGGASSGRGGGGGGSKDNKSNKTEIDWIARKLERLQKVIDLTKAKFENLFDLKSKSSNLDKQIEQTTELQKANEKAADKYSKKASNYAKKSKLSKSLQTAVHEGRLDGYSLDKLIKKYGEKIANKINKYKGYWDQAQEAQQQVEELTATLRELQEQQYQLYVDDAEANISKLNAQKDIAIGYEEQNKYLEAQKAYLKQSYDYQIMIAGLTQDETKKAQLLAEYQKELIKLEKEKFDNISSYYDSEIKLLQYQEDSLNRQAEILETRGDLINDSFYRKEIGYEREKLKMYNEENSALQKQINTIPKGTEEWYDAVDALESVKTNIDDCTKSIADLNNKIIEFSKELHNRVMTEFDRTNSQAQLFAKMFEGYDFYDENTASITNAGLVTLSSYNANRNLSYAKASESIEDLKKLNNARENWNGNEFVINIDGVDVAIDSLNELDDWIKTITDEYNDNISSALEANNSIIEFQIQGLQAQLSVLKEIVDVRKEEINAMKDLHDYQMSIKESTDDIASLQKQLSAVRGDNSEEGIARQQKLQKQLDEAQKSLNDKEYDRYISDQQEMLDNLAQEYENIINARSKERDLLLREGIDTVVNSSEKISDSIYEFSEKVGYDLAQINEKQDAITSMTTSFSDIFNPESGSFGSVVSSIKSTIEQWKAEENRRNEEEEARRQAEEEARRKESENVNTPASLPSIKHELPEQTPIDAMASAWGGYIEPTTTPIDILGKQGNGKLGNGDTVTIAAGSKKYKGKELSKNDGTLNNSYTGTIIDHDGQTSALVEYQGANGKKTYWFKKKDLSGYSKGGIVDFKIPNGDDGIIAAKQGEGILTPLQTKLFTEQLVPAMNDFIDASKYIKVPNYAILKKPSNSINGDINFNVSLPNVKDKDTFIHELQNNSEIRRAIQDISIGTLNGNSRLSINKYR